MAKQSQGKRSGSPGKKARRLKYYLARMGQGYVHNKLSRILKRNGLEAAQTWANGQLGGLKILRLIQQRRGDEQ